MESKYRRKALDMWSEENKKGKEEVRGKIKQLQNKKGIAGIWSFVTLVFFFIQE